ncbi:MAG: glycosyltransferase [Candidatus Gastranaerophilaceae bacterium]
MHPNCADIVPYPHAAADHQRKMRNMVEQGAGLYIEDKEITDKILLNNILALINDSDKLAELQKSSLSLAKFDGTEKIVEQLKEVANDK